MESLAAEQKKKEVRRKKKGLVRLEGRARKTCFERRRKGLQKKASQLASLCGLRIALLIKDIDDAPDMHTWPPNLDEVQRTVVSYQHRAFDVKAGNTTGKKGMQADACNFASPGSKKTKSNHQGLGNGVRHCGCYLDDHDAVYARKLDSINHRIGVIMMAKHTDSMQVPSVPSGSCSADWCDIMEPVPFSEVAEIDESPTDLVLAAACSPDGIVAYNAAWGDDFLTDDLNGDTDATQLMNPLAEATSFCSDFGSCSVDCCDITEQLPFSEVAELDDSRTNLGPPATCCPTGILAYNAAWGDDTIPDDLNGDINATQLMNQLAEATTFCSDFRSCSVDWCDITEPLPFSKVAELDDSRTDLGPPASCCPTGIVAYNATWGDDTVQDDLNDDSDATQLMYPLAEATAFCSVFGSSSATGSDYMELGPEEDFYQWHLSDVTEMEEDELFASSDPLIFRPFSPSSLFDPSTMLHSTAMLPDSNSIDC